MTDQGFFKASSSNLPCVDLTMIVEFFSSNDKYVDAEFKGVKNARAGRESYGDDAVGYVQLKRSGVECVIKGRVTPEHKVRSKCYSVMITIDESAKSVTSANCLDCAASAGGCKHAIALLMWVHRRSEDPSPTAIDCYWKKSKLSSVGSICKFVTAADLCPSNTCRRRLQQNSEPTGDTSFLSEFIKRASELKANCQLLKHFEEGQPSENLSLHNLSFLFVKNRGSVINGRLSRILQAANARRSV